MNAFNKTYRFLADHLTKALGAIGGAVMTVAMIDPAPIHEAAVTYLGAHAAAKVGGILFGMVILRGWYTGQKAKQAS